MSSSIGMIIPNIWKNKSNVPNHQPVIYYILKYQKIVDHSQKHISWDDDIPMIIPNILWKIKVMFETTNQLYI